MMNGILDQLDAGFVMAVILFLVIFLFGLFAGLSDLVWRKIEEKKDRDYFAKFNEPIGKITDYRVISNGYKTVQSSKIKIERKR